jgi:hypothetical protein
MNFSPEERAILKKLLGEFRENEEKLSHKVESAMVQEGLAGPQLLTEAIANPFSGKYAIQENIVAELRADPNSNKIRLKGLFQEANKYNQNKRWYDKGILEREVERLLPMAKDKRITGEMDHPNTPQIRFTHPATGNPVGSHYVTELWFENNHQIHGELEPATTKMGQELRAYIRDGYKIGISSRGTGSLTAESNGNFRVNDDYRMVTFDVVTDPSVFGAFPKQHSESVSTTVQKDTKKELTHEDITSAVLRKLGESLKIPELIELANAKR